MLIMGVIDNIHLHGFGSSSINSSLESLGLSENQILKFKKPIGEKGYKSQAKKNALFNKFFEKNCLIDDSFKVRFLELLSKPWEPNQKAVYELFPEYFNRNMTIHEYALCAIDVLVADMIRDTGELRKVVIANKDGFLGKLLAATIRDSTGNDREFTLKINIELAIAVACAYEHDRNYISGQAVPMIPIWLKQLDRSSSLRARYFELLREGLKGQGVSFQKLLDHKTHQDKESARTLIRRWAKGENRPSKALVYRVFETLSKVEENKYDQLKLLNHYQSTYKCILALDYIFHLIPKDPEFVAFVRNRYMLISHALKVEAVTNWGAIPMIDLAAFYSVLTTVSSSPAKFKDRYLCPCCYLPSLTERNQNQICGVCTWQDDGRDSDDEDDIGLHGCNRNYSLADSRANFQKNQSKFSKDDEAFISPSEEKLQLIDSYKRVLITESEDHWAEMLDLEQAYHK
ncbi:hypothetical protein NBRC116188_19780 [Oceaniserpentilla sp. 4NH20-0058]|uniref:CPCC family cysteine-rich protein n=1 Tax=Oceaniserpentilla sp. 4NH20-0058 TaxID=3127660 RepID=UPI003103F466